MAIANDTEILDFKAYFDMENRQDSRLAQVEHMTVMKYIHEYLSPDMKILDIGAGGGRYSLELASEGYNVTAVEMLQAKLNELNSKITEPMRLITYKGEITDLGFLSGESFDMTLVLGPMYHLYTYQDKKKAAAEALRVTKPGGVILVEYCISDAFISDLCFFKGQVQSLIKHGLLDSSDFRLRCLPEMTFDMVRKSDVDDLMSEFIVTRLHYIAAAPAAVYSGEALEDMDDETFEYFMKYHFSVCERPDLVGASMRCVDIFKKKKPLHLRYVTY